MRAASAPYRIAISGSYGGMNLGDEAILEGILSGLRGAVPAHVTVFSRNPRIRSPDTASNGRLIRARSPAGR